MMKLRLMALGIAAAIRARFPGPLPSRLSWISPRPWGHIEFTGTGTSGSFKFDNNGSGEGFDITSSTGVGDSTAAFFFRTIGGTFSYSTSLISTFGPLQIRR